MKKLLSLLFMTIFFIGGCSSEISVTAPPTEIPTVIVEAEPTKTPTDTPTEAPLPENSSFTVHYIDVGQADSALVLCDGQAMLIDGGNVADSSLIVAYLKKLNINYLDYIVCTHAHEDHVGGLSGALSVAGAGTVYAPETTAESDAYENFGKKVTGQDLQITHPSHGSVINLGNSSVNVIKLRRHCSKFPVKRRGILLVIMNRKTPLFVLCISHKQNSKPTVPKPFFS